MHGYRVGVAGALFLAAASVHWAKDTPEEAREKAIRKNQEALLNAAKKGQVETVRASLLAGTDVNARDGSQRTALLHAVRGGHLDVVRVLIEARADLDAQDEDGNTALMEAAKRDEAMPALDLVSAGADVNLADKDGRTALMGAVKKGTLAAARSIIRSPIQSSLDTLSKDGHSALSIASERGRAAIVRELIKAGVGIRDPAVGGRALQIAAEKDFADIAVALMEAQAPLGYAGWDGELPLHAAASRGHEEVVAALLEGGIDPDETDRDGQTALIKAAASGHEQVVTSLLRLGAAPSISDHNDWTALTHAAAHLSSGSIGTIGSLVRAGAEVDRRIGKERKTALMIAAEKGNELALDALLRAGAQPDLQSATGESALDLALAEGFKRCAEMLGYKARN